MDPEAFSHPAKFSRSLIRRIYAYLREKGYLKPGDTVLDIFGGTGLGAWDAMHLGCYYIGVELEERFWIIGQRNLALWRQRFGYDTGILLQGDSRKLCEVLEQARIQGIVASPPFASSDTQPTGLGAGKPSRDSGDGAGRNKGDYVYGTDPGNLGRFPVGALILSSPPYAEAIQNVHSGIDKTKGVDPRDPQSASVRRAEELAEGYGISKGQLGGMKPGAMVCSPPFLGARSGTTASTETSGGGPCAERVHTVADGDRLGTTDGNLAAMPIGCVISSPPFCESLSSGKLSDAMREDLTRSGHKPSASGTEASYGSAPGQLASLPVGCVVSSPPFGSSTQVNNTPTDMTAGPATWGNGTDSAARVKQDYADYAADSGNLGRLPMGAAVISSPPFSDMNAKPVTGIDPLKHQSKPMGPNSMANSQGFGISDGQLGIMRTGTGADPETFWGASAIILAQCFKVLLPGSVAAFVLKDYVRSGKIVPFCTQWRQCCESVGFVFVEEIHAMLVEDHGTQSTLFGEDEKIVTSKKSFFRILAERRGSPKINYETVLIMMKPQLP